MSWGDNQIIFEDGMQSFGSFAMALTDFNQTPPELITHYVDIPGRIDGYLDLTDSLTGSAVYSARDMTFGCVVMIDEGDHMQWITQLYAYLHGKQKKFTLSFDPEYTYTGRFTVEGIDQSHRNLLTVTLKAKCKPYKHKETMTYALNGAGGMNFKFLSGTRPVNPTVECSQAIVVHHEGNKYYLGGGTWRLNDVIFRSGINSISINTVEMRSVTWANVKQGGTFAMTWSQAKASTWNNHSKKGLEQSNGFAAQCWNDLSEKYSWKNIVDAKKTWDELNFTADGNSAVYLQYDWEDL